MTQRRKIKTRSLKFQTLEPRCMMAWDTSVALRSTLFNQGYLHFITDSVLEGNKDKYWGGNERTGYTDIRNPARVGSTDSTLGFDMSTLQVSIHAAHVHRYEYGPPEGNFVGKYPNGVLDVDALRRDFDVANSIFSQAGISVVQDGRSGAMTMVTPTRNYPDIGKILRVAKERTPTGAISVAYVDALTLGGAVEHAANFYPNRDPDSTKAIGLPGAIPNFKPGKNEGILFADNLAADTFAHEITRYLLGGASPKLFKDIMPWADNGWRHLTAGSDHYHSGTPSNITADFGTRAIVSVTQRKDGANSGLWLKDIEGNAAGRIGTSVANNGGLKLGPITTTQLEAMFYSESIQGRSNYRNGFGDRVDFNWVEDNRTLEGVKNLDPKLGADSLFWTIDTLTELPKSGLDIDHGNWLSNMGNLPTAAFDAALGWFDVVDVFSQIARYTDMEKGLDGAWSRQNAALDYFIWFSEDGSTWVQGTEDKLFSQGWTEASTADDYVARWKAVKSDGTPLHAKYVSIRAKTGDIWDGNTQIDAIVAGRTTEVKDLKATGFRKQESILNVLGIVIVPEHWQVSYEVEGNVSTPFKISIYSSTDGLTTGTKLGEIWSTSATYTGSGRYDADLPTAWAPTLTHPFLIAIVDGDANGGGQIAELNENNNRATSEGLRLAGGTLYVFTSSMNDNVQISETVFGTLINVSATIDATNGYDQHSLGGVYLKSLVSTIEIHTNGAIDSTEVYTTVATRQYGGTGGDTLRGGLGANELYGEDGDDTLIADYWDPYFVGTLPTAGSKLYGGRGNDVLIGGRNADELYGEDGNDSLTGKAGDDLLSGGLGDDTYVFAVAAPPVNPPALTEPWRPLGHDTIAEAYGQGTDTLQFGGMYAGIRVDLAEEGALQSVLVDGSINVLQLTLNDGWGIDHVVGSAFDDEIYGNELSNQFVGGEGDDALYGRLGSDTYLYPYDATASINSGLDEIFEALGAFEADDWDRIVSQQEHAAVRVRVHVDEATLSALLEGPQTLDIRRGMGLSFVPNNSGTTSTFTIDELTGLDHLGNEENNTTDPNPEYVPVASITLSSDTTIDADLGSNLAIRVLGGVTEFTTTQHLARLEIVGGDVVLTAGNNSVLVLAGLMLDVDAGVALDLGDGDMVLRNGSLWQITLLIASAYNGGAWDGAGITSSSARNDPSALTSLGLIFNDDGTGMPLFYADGVYLPLFSGEEVDSTAVLVKFTYAGDSDLNGLVDGTDYALIDNGFLMNLEGWLNGDLNFDGVVDGTDYAMIDNAYIFQSGPL